MRCLCCDGIRLWEFLAFNEAPFITAAVLDVDCGAVTKL
jgi:hypothetical protein